MTKDTQQMAKWEGEFGQEFTKRNIYNPEETDTVYMKMYNLSRTDLNREFLGDLDRATRIVEIGCNMGNQLFVLQKMGFASLYGVEIQDYALGLARQMTKGINIVKGSAFDIPFKDDFCAIIFTSGVLIHISPADIKEALTEMHRCTRKYIWGFEYFSEKYTEIEYRGQTNILWKTNFCQLYLDTFKDLRLVREKKVKFVDNDNINQMFLLEKK